MITEWSLSNPPLESIEHLDYVAEWVCRCGAVWKESLNSRGNPARPGCKPCRLLDSVTPKVSVADDPGLLAFWDSQRNESPAFTVASQSSKKMFWVCAYGHSFVAAVNNFSRSRRCDRCSKPQTADEWERYLQSNYGIGKAFLIQEYQVSGRSLDDIWASGGPGHGVLRPALKAFGLKRTSQESMALREQRRIATWIDRYGVYQPAARISSPSKPEYDVAATLSELGIAFVHQEKRLIAPKEIDFLLVDYPLALEYNGLHWHDKPQYLADLKAGTAVSKEMQKVRLCAAQGVALIHVWEDEWLAAESRQEFVLGKIDLTLRSQRYPNDV